MTFFEHTGCFGFAEPVFETAEEAQTASCLSALFTGKLPSPLPTAASATTQASPASTAASSASTMVPPASTILTGNLQASVSPSWGPRPNRPRSRSLPNLDASKTRLDFYEYGQIQFQSEQVEELAGKPKSHKRRR